MCNVGKTQILESVRVVARETIDSLRDVPEVAHQAKRMGSLLESAAPIVMPLSRPLPGQLTPTEFLRYEPVAYPSVLEQLVGPPLRLGSDRLLGFVMAECALAALRRGQVQGALSALFLSSLCAWQLEEPAAEALHHMLVESDQHGFIGLFELGGRRSGTPSEQMMLLRRRHNLRFVAAAVQLGGAFGGQQNG